MTTSFKALETWLSSPHPEVELQARRASGWLQRHLPEVDRLYGIPQVAEHHPEIDVGRHIELTLGMAAQLSNDPRVRYAALIHDLGKALTRPEQWPKHHSHEALGVRPGLKVGQRFGVPKDWRRLGALVSVAHLQAHRTMALPARSVVRLFRQAGFFERPALFEPFVLACEADARGREGLQNRPYPQGDRLRAAFAIARTVDTSLEPDRAHQERVRRLVASGICQASPAALATTT